MKVELNRKILRVAVVEILMQLGFEKCTEQSLNIVTEVFSYYLEALIKSIAFANAHTIEKSEENKFESRKKDILLYKLLTDFYINSEYQYDELLCFASQQISIVDKIIENKSCTSDCENMLSLLKFLPRNQSLKRLYKNTKNAIFEAKEEKEEKEEVGEVELDAFLKQFIDKCEMKFAGMTEIEPKEYVYDLGKALDSTEKEMDFEIFDTKYNSKAKEDQKSFFDDFYKPKKILIKKSTKQHKI
ncbi:hypothetical protein NUSPORA_02143 [Nucleospora cyclopteri]